MEKNSLDDRMEPESDSVSYVVSFTSGSRAATPHPRQELPLERGGPPDEVLYYWRDATYERT
jgi:hypothetical protein